MPKPRSRDRIVYCDCFDCLDRPEAVPTSLSAAEAVARQIPPPKALLLFGSGFLRHHGGIINLDTCTFPHLDRIAKDGCVGRLALQSQNGEGSSASWFSQAVSNTMMDFAPCTVLLLPFQRRGWASCINEYKGALAVAWI